MNQITYVPIFSRPFDCGHCGQKISTSQLLLLRESSALPEEPTVHTHGSCADSFIEAHPGQWNKIETNSLDAGWLLY